MARGKKHTDAQVELALQALIEHDGNAEAASKDTGIPARTLRDWRGKEFADEFARLRREKRKGFIEKVWEVAGQALDELMTKLPEMKGKDIAITIGILADKGLAAGGEASRRIDVTSADKPLEGRSDDERIERLFSIFDEARARRDSEPSD